MSPFLDILRDTLLAAGGIALIGTFWLTVQHYARKQAGLTPDQDMLDRPCSHCGHRSEGCGMGSGHCPL